VRFFSDVKLGNVVLRKVKGQYDAVLIDFKKRGAWLSPYDQQNYTPRLFSNQQSRARGRQRGYRGFLDAHVLGWGVGQGE
jgi:hypothetical protein